MTESFFHIKICSFRSDNCAHVSIKKFLFLSIKKNKGDNLLLVIMAGVTGVFTIRVIFKPVADP